MIRIIVCLLLLLLLTENGWSQQQFHYENYFYYRNHQYLQTSSVLLSGAVLKAVSGDSTEALNLVRSAVLRVCLKSHFWVNLRSKSRIIAISTKA